MSCIRVLLVAMTRSLHGAARAHHATFGAASYPFRRVGAGSARCDLLFHNREPGDAVTDSATYERRGPAAWIRLARPERMNAIAPDVIEAIEAGLARAATDGARAVVITGSGGVFCAGADLKHVLRGLDD